MNSPVFVALDTADLDQAIGIARSVQPYVGGLKAGLEFYSAQGPKGVRRLAEFGLPIFLDLKLHDIPNTVAASIHALSPLGVQFLTVHASGGPAMLRAAADAAPAGLTLLAVTVLTSLDHDDLEQVGQRSPIGAQVERLALLSRECGIDGLISSPAEIAILRTLMGQGATLMVPGIRPEGTSSDDQKRTMTPSEALDAGANYLVIGRPITKATDPAAAAAAIMKSLSP